MPDTGLAQWLTLTELAERTGRKLDAIRAWGQRRRRERRHSWRKSNSGEWTVEATPEVLSELASGAVLYRPWEVLTDAPPSALRVVPVRQELPRPVLGG